MGEADRATTSGPAPRVGYLLSRYPAISHTFFLQEVRGLRALGFSIETASINLPDRTRDALPAIEAEESAHTYYVKANRGLRGARAALAAVLLAPSATLRALRAAYRLSPGSVAQRFYMLFYVVEALLLCTWIRRKGIQHLHVHFGGPVATVGLITAAAARVPYSLTIHGPDEFFDESIFYLRQKVEGASFVICISHYCRSQLMRITSPVVWDRLEIVRLGVQPEMLPSRLVRADDTPLQIISVGRLVSTKGPLLLLQALRTVMQQDVNVVLTMVGDGAERAALQAYIARHGMESAVTLTGALNHQQTLERVAAADIFVLASFAEGVPVALMEAMALGVPCISTYIAGIPELIRDGENGILVPAGSVADLAAAILQMVKDAPLRQRFSEAARARVLREYHLPDNLELLAQVLRRRLTHD